MAFLPLFLLRSVFNPYVTNKLSYPYHYPYPLSFQDMFYFISFLMKFLSANSIARDETPRSVCLCRATHKI